jgi:ABC-type antimicrobial peptide transport system permease subunit
VEVVPLADLLAPQVQPWRMGVSVLAFFGGLCLLLALVGLYGVIAHTMARRTYEIAVRVAMGAQPAAVLWLAARQGLAIAALGAVGGLVLTRGAARYLQPLLFQVSASDPYLLGGAAAFLLGLTLAASILPGRRYRKLDPAPLLRAE